MRDLYTPSTPFVRPNIQLIFSAPRDRMEGRAHEKGLPSSLKRATTRRYIWSCYGCSGAQLALLQKGAVPGSPQKLKTHQLRLRPMSAQSPR
ncbi:hypothetical protein P154DRAFT_36294 [Amniculicola lignicola CBS 123094]|uniref:Uncharacterized protein n=1 Tax=Amniculicola lignicola CBS 123094 TaxID=1392246 RepID=A0A6A5WUQ5_9PLEO|nr:hypothetical protein P154DRAFT_36294 [Amniculicola lignicola CBS 123094]